MHIDRKTKLKKERRSSRKVFRIIKAIFYLLLVGGVLYGVWYLTHLPNLSITQIVVEGGETVDEGALRSKLDSLLAGNYVGIVSRRFIYAYPRKALLASVSEFPRVSKGDITRKGTTLTVSLGEFTPLALWCSESSTPCFYVNEAGIAYDEAPSLRGSLLSRYVTTDVTPVLGGEPLNEDVQYLVTELRRLLRINHQFLIERVEYTKDKDIFFHLAGGGVLMFTSNQKPETVYQNLLSILESEEFMYLRPGNFNYIDLRFGQKVFIGEETVVEEETATTTAE